MCDNNCMIKKRKLSYPTNVSKINYESCLQNAHTKKHVGKEYNMKSVHMTLHLH
jgi:hypothetical protein